MLDRTKLAAAILADRKPDKDDPSISTCFACGGRFVASAFGRFCSRKIGRAHV